MSWTAPRTWVTGELVLASHLNVHLRDNILDRYTNRSIFDTQVQFNSTITPTLSAHQDNWNPTGFSTCNYVRLDPTTDALEISGFAAQPAGTFFFVRNVNTGANRARFMHEVTSSTPNRISVAGIALAVFISPGQAGLVFYDGTSSRWIFIAGPGVAP